METTEERDKPWRPADHPRPGPSWVEQASPSDTESQHKGVPDGED